MLRDCYINIVLFNYVTFTCVQNIVESVQPTQWNDNNMSMMSDIVSVHSERLEHLKIHFGIYFKAESCQLNVISSC